MISVSSGNNTSRICAKGRPKTTQHLLRLSHEKSTPSTAKSWNALYTSCYWQEETEENCRNSHLASVGYKWARFCPLTGNALLSSSIERLRINLCLIPKNIAIAKRPAKIQNPKSSSCPINFKDFYPKLACEVSNVLVMPLINRPLQ